MTFPAAGILTVTAVCVWFVRDEPRSARSGNRSVFGRRVRDVLLNDAAALLFHTINNNTTPPAAGRPKDKLPKASDLNPPELLFESPDLRTLTTAQLLPAAETKQPTGTVIPSISFAPYFNILPSFAGHNFISCLLNGQFSLISGALMPH